MSYDLARQLFMLLFVAVAAWFDVRKKRIPNWLSLIGLAGGLLWAILFAGRAAYAGDPWLGFAIGFGAMLLLYFLKGVGAGDVKMLAGFGLLAGYPDIIYYLFFSSLASAVLMLVPLAWRGELWSWFRRGVRLGKRGPAEAEPTPVSTSYALGLLIGTVWVFVLEAL